MLKSIPYFSGVGIVTAGWPARPPRSRSPVRAAIDEPMRMPIRMAEILTSGRRWIKAAMMIAMVIPPIARLLGLPKSAAALPPARLLKPTSIRLRPITVTTTPVTVRVIMRRISGTIWLSPISTRQPARQVPKMAASMASSLLPAARIARPPATMVATNVKLVP